MPVWGSSRLRIRPVYDTAPLYPVWVLRSDVAVPQHFHKTWSIVTVFGLWAAIWPRPTRLRLLMLSKPKSLEPGLFISTHIIHAHQLWPIYTFRYALGAISSSLAR